MRMKSVKKSRNLRDAVNEFLSFKKAQKVRERTLYCFAVTLCFAQSGGESYITSAKQI